DRALVARRGERAPEAPVRQPLWALVVEHDGFLLDRAAVVGVQPRAHRLVVALLVGEERRRGLLLTARLTGDRRQIVVDRQRAVVVPRERYAVQRPAGRIGHLPVDHHVAHALAVLGACD